MTQRLISNGSQNESSSLRKADNESTEIIDNLHVCFVQVATGSDCLLPPWHFCTLHICHRAHVVLTVLFTGFTALEHAHQRR